MDNQTLFLIPGDGADSQWYKNVLQTPRIRLSAQGTEQIAQATPITDSNGVTRIVEAFQDKYGRRQMAALYPKCEKTVLSAVELELFTLLGTDGWCREAGFKDFEVIPLTGPTSAGIAYK